MKESITAREIRRVSKVVFKAHSRLHMALLEKIDPDRYNAGVYGWNYDVWFADLVGYPGVTFTAGYRPIGVDIPDAIEDKYTKKAEHLEEKWSAQEDRCSVRRLMSRRRAYQRIFSGLARESLDSLKGQ